MAPRLLTELDRMRYIGRMSNPTTKPIPSAAEVRAMLGPLRRAQIVRLAELSAVSFNTLQKIASGETADPRLDTVRQFLPHIEAAAKHGVEA